VLTAGEVELTNSPLTFIDGLVGLLGPLISGCPVVVATVGADVDGLVAALARHSVTRVTLVPTLLAAIFELIPDVGCRIPTLRILRCSGEPLRPELLARFRTSLPRCTLLNLYGSTEVSGDCTCAVFSPRIDAAIAAVDRASVDVTQSVDIASCTESSITDKHPSVGTASVTIGTPIAGATCTVDGRDNGTGIGELVVGGPLLALRWVAPTQPCFLATVLVVSLHGRAVRSTGLSWDKSSQAHGFELFGLRVFRIAASMELTTDMRPPSAIGTGETRKRQPRNSSSTRAVRGSFGPATASGATSTADSTL
jgi:hypothetical protein